MRRKQNAIGEQFIAHRRDMREAAAWRHLPNNARRILDRLELEHMIHGSADNGRLPCTYRDFEAAGIRRQAIALAIRQCVALGFLEITREGRRSAGEFRRPALYRLTYLQGCGQSPNPTHDWTDFVDDAKALAALAGLSKIRRYDKQPNRPRGRLEATLPCAAAEETHSEI